MLVKRSFLETKHFHLFFNYPALRTSLNHQFLKAVGKSMIVEPNFHKVRLNHQGCAVRVLLLPFSSMTFP
jgi:hypothetical protein